MNAASQVVSLLDQTGNRRWQSLLEGQSRQTALAIIRQLASQLPVEIPPQASGSQDHESASARVYWKAEIALFYGYLAKAFDDENFSELAYEYLNHAIAEAAQHQASTSLLGGLTEIGWIIAHLSRNMWGEEAAENCSAIDEFLNDHLSQATSGRDFDLINGLAGYGIYAIERLPQATASEIAAKVVRRLQQIAEHNELGITWHTGPELLPEWQSRLCPDGYYNLGVAHGVPGVIGMLAQACAVGEVAESARTLLDGAVSWLLANRSYDGHGAYLTYWLTPGGKPELARQAWCYGELGAATALLLAARCVDNRGWEEAALELLRRSALRQVADSGVKDAGLCHGATGNAHLFNRIYQATGENVFKQAALYWYEHAFDFRTQGRGIGGFQTWNPAEAAGGWDTNASFLEGAAGIGLALLAAATDIEPHWDRLLLASIPPRGNRSEAERNIR